VLDGNLRPGAWVHRGLRTNGGRFLGTYLREHADQGSARTLKAFLNLCGSAGRARCAFAAGSAAATRAKYAALLRRLKAHPKSADVTYAELVSATVGALYEPGGWPEFAKMLQQIWRTGAASRPLASYSRIPMSPPASDLAPSAEHTASAPSTYSGPEQAFAVVCSESPNPAASVFRLGDAFAADRSGDVGHYWWWASGACVDWPAFSPDTYGGPWNRRTANPVLVIGNTHDPATPYRGAVAMSRQLARGRLLTLRGYGHTSGPDPSTCIGRALVAYLVRVATPKPGAACQADRVPFDPHFGEPAL
jgi:hypothetical protein